jgi:hypothetical protein
MPKADKSNTTNRRAFLSKMAAGVAAGATAAALVAVPALALPVDPAFAALEQLYKARSELKEARAAHSTASIQMQESGLFPYILSKTPRPLGPLQGYGVGNASTFWPVMFSHADIDKFSPQTCTPKTIKLEHEELSAAISRHDERINTQWQVRGDKSNHPSRRVAAGYLSPYYPASQ